MSWKVRVIEKEQKNIELKIKDWNIKSYREREK